MEKLKFEYGFKSVNGIIKKVYYLHEIPNIATKCDVWTMLPLVYVRQFTGITVKDNNELFEGDRVNNTGVPGGYLGTIKHSKGAYVIKWDEEVKDDLLYDYVYDGICDKLEVIGSIHD